MTSAKVTAKGQITVPLNVRKALHLQTGDRIDFVEVSPGRFEVSAACNVWVLSSCYDQKKPEISAVLTATLTTQHFMIERSNLVYTALSNYKKGSGDFSDALIAASGKEAGCKMTVTFDRKAASVGMTVL